MKRWKRLEKSDGLLKDAPNTTSAERVAGGRHSFQEGLDMPQKALVCHQKDPLIILRAKHNAPLVRKEDAHPLITLRAKHNCALCLCRLGKFRPARQEFDGLREAVGRVRSYRRTRTGCFGALPSNGASQSIVPRGPGDAGAEARCRRAVAARARRVLAASTGRARRAELCGNQPVRRCTRYIRHQVISRR